MGFRDCRCLAHHLHLQPTKRILYPGSAVIDYGKLLKTPTVSLDVRSSSRLIPERMRAQRAGIELPSGVRDGKYQHGMRTLARCIGCVWGDRYRLCKQRGYLNDSACPRKYMRHDLIFSKTPGVPWLKKAVSAITLTASTIIS